MAKGPGLSVYHGPIVQLAKQYVGDNVMDITGSDPHTIYEYIAKELPVWVITTTKFKPVHNFQTWQTPSGEVKVTFSVHSVVVTGYDNDYVYVNNPYGMKDQKVHKKLFEEAWIQMGRQAVVSRNKCFNVYSFDRLFRVFIHYKLKGRNTPTFFN